MQPSASAIDGVKLMKGEVGVEYLVNEAAFLKKRVQDVPVNINNNANVGRDEGPGDDNERALRR